MKQEPVGTGIVGNCYAGFLNQNQITCFWIASVCAKCSIESASTSPECSCVYFKHEPEQMGPHGYPILGQASPPPASQPALDLVLKEKGAPQGGSLGNFL